jgi:hypothetical protein
MRVTACHGVLHFFNSSSFPPSAAYFKQLRGIGLLKIRLTLLDALLSFHFHITSSFS